jgi:hypothetical protein
MSRVTDDDVREIIELEADQDIEPFISVAHELVNTVCTSPLLTTKLLFEIERWLSAHFAAVGDPRTFIEKADEVSIHYQTKLGYDLRVTHWGQQAIVLDISGALAALGQEKKVASLKYIGGSRVYS